MDLTSVQFTQLQEYIRRYQHVDNLEELFQVIDWRHLHRLLNVNDDSLLRDKVEEVYQDAKEEIYTSPIFLDEELNNIDSLAFIDDNPYHGEVSAMFGALGLKEVNQELNQPEQPENNHHIEQHSSQPRKYGSALSEADGSKHMRGLPVNSAPLNPFVLGAATLSKPASTEMTNLNVLSKASLTASSLQPETKKKKKKSIFTPLSPSKITSFQIAANKLNYIRRKSFGLSTTPTSTTLVPIAAPNSSSPSKNATTGDSNSTLSAAQANHIRFSTLDLPTTKANRRTSMVEDHLPLYIRKQLSLESPKVNESSATIIVPSTAPTGDEVDVGEIPLTNLPASNLPPINPSLKKMSSSRLQNVLMNSQSLYTISKNTSLPPSREESQASTTVSSDSFVSDRVDGIDFEEDDKQYVLPTLISPYLGYQDVDDDDNGDMNDIDFANLSYEEEEDLEDEDEDDELDDIQDDYLFK